jgi:hypothetical protein
MAKAQGGGAGWRAAVLSVWIAAAHIWYFLQFKSELIAALRSFVGGSWR